VKIKIKSEKLNAQDMVIDFGDLKKIVDSAIMDSLDHSLLINEKDEFIPSEVLDKSRCFRLIKDPTAEYLSQFIYEHLRLSFKPSHDNNYMRLVSVKIWENEDSCATYTEE
jgi:6-pyruvoyl-tetrahydropterin synthase